MQHVQRLTCSGDLSHSALHAPAALPGKGWECAHLETAAPAGLLKTQALRGTMRDVQTDERAAFAFDMCQASAEQLLQWVYPPLYPVHDISTPWGKPDDKGR
jgi:hypothetical protein